MFRKSGEQIRRDIRDQSNDSDDIYNLEAYAQGTEDEIAEQYAKCRTAQGRRRYCRALSYSLQQVGAIPPGLKARRDAAASFKAYLDADHPERDYEDVR